MERAREMLEALKRDYFAALIPPPHYTGDVYTDRYKKLYNVSDEDIRGYLETLTMINPTHKTCPICGQEWHYFSKQAQLMGNGQLIDLVDSMHVWCAGVDDKKHHTLWYYQDSDGRVEMELELNSDLIKEHDWVVHWGFAPDGKLVENMVIDTGGPNYDMDHKVLATFSSALPFAVSREDVARLLQQEKESQA